MDCGFLDFRCYAQGWIWEWWADLGTAKQVMLVAGVLLIILGISWGVLTFLKRVGGWPAVVGGLLLIVVGVLSVIPKKPEPKAEARAPTVMEDGTPIRKKPRTRTILDMLPKR
jgi:vacuolar-type H+-ATPase subunit I/STV1